MGKSVVLLQLNPAQREMLQRAAPDLRFVWTSPRDVTEAHMMDAEVILGNPPPQMLQKAEHLRWLQLQSAGADEYLKGDLLREDVMLTNATGAFGTALAEHLMTMLLYLCKRMDRYTGLQREHCWMVPGQAKVLKGCRVLIVGLGDVGSAFAKMVKAMDTHVTGVRRTGTSKPWWVDELYLFQHIDELLPQADVVACCLPSTPQTHRILNKERLRSMKQGAILLNVGRGDSVDTKELVELLHRGHLWGAGLDVIEKEPLPPESPWWDTPNLLLTPHAAGKMHAGLTLEAKLDIFCRNLSAYCRGDTLHNLVDRNTGYRGAEEAK